MHVLGGFARGNSVTFISDEYSATAIRKKNGIKVITKKRPFLKNDSYIYKMLSKLPFFRNLINYLSLMFQSKIVLLILVIALLESLIPESTNNVLYNHLIDYMDQFVTILCAVFVIFIFIKFKDLKKYHGAEHKTLNALCQTGETSLTAVRKASRVHERCGTNFLVVILLFASIIQLIARWDFDYSVLLGMALASGVIASENRFMKPIIRIGGFIQKYFLTAEPEENELYVAICALEALVNIKES